MLNLAFFNILHRRYEFYVRLDGYMRCVTRLQPRFRAAGLSIIHYRGTKQT